MVYIGSIPASLQRKRTITVGQQDEDHEEARDPDARSMPCSTVGAGDRLVVALFPFAAIGGGLVVGTTAGGAPLGAVAGRAAAGMSRHERRGGLASSWMRVRRAWLWSPSPIQALPAAASP